MCFIESLVFLGSKTQCLLVLVGKTAGFFDKIIILILTNLSLSNKIIIIRRPRPWPRQGRRLGPPQVWNLSFLATGIPRPHQWLLMGVQACGLPAPKPLQPSKRSTRSKTSTTLKPLKQSMASYGRPAHAKATPRPDPSLLQGGPKCRSPGLLSQQASQGHIHGFLWASKLAVCQPLSP